MTTTRRSNHRWLSSSAFKFKGLLWQHKLPTCGLRISDRPTSDNLNPRESTTPDDPDMGPDVASLSCPGSSVVANSRGEGRRFENSAAPESIGPDHHRSFSSQSLPDDSEAGEEPMKLHRIG
jgi:hypothetical protein